MITFFNEFYKNSIEPQIGNVDYTIINNHKCWFKTTSNEIILDVLGVNESGTLAQITLNDNLFIGGSSGSDLAQNIFGDRTRTIFRNGTKTPANVEDVFITPYIPTIGDDVNSFKHIKQEFFSHQYFS